MSKVTLAMNCEKPFKSKSNLKQHTETVLQELNMHLCEFCEK